MQANWSLILNVLLLVGVIVAIGRLMQARRQSLSAQRYQPNTTERPSFDNVAYQDDIIAVRKVPMQPSLEDELPTLKQNAAPAPQPRLMPEDAEPVLVVTSETKPAPKITIHVDEEEEAEQVGATLMMFLLAKENRQFAGYELLQTVLAAGLRFGETGLFHRHQFTNGDGPVICSLAAATESGVFDLHNIGAFSVRGLCLYMQATNNPDADAERFSIMLDTIKQLSDGLDAYLLDDQRRPLTEQGMQRYYQMLQLNQAHIDLIAV